MLWMQFWLSWMTQRDRTLRIWIRLSLVQLHVFLNVHLFWHFEFGEKYTNWSFYIQHDCSLSYCVSVKAHIHQVKDNLAKSSQQLVPAVFTNTWGKLVRILVCWPGRGLPTPPDGISVSRSSSLWSPDSLVRLPPPSFSFSPSCCVKCLRFYGAKRLRWLMYMWRVLFTSSVPVHSMSDDRFFWCWIWNEWTHINPVLACDWIWVCVQLCLVRSRERFMESWRWTSWMKLSGTPCAVGDAPPAEPPS